MPFEERMKRIEGQSAGDAQIRELVKKLKLEEITKAEFNRGVAEIRENPIEPPFRGE